MLSFVYFRNTQSIANDLHFFSNIDKSTANWFHISIGWKGIFGYPEMFKCKMYLIVHWSILQNKKKMYLWRNGETGRFTQAICTFLCVKANKSFNLITRIQKLGFVVLPYETLNVISSSCIVFTPVCVRLPSAIGYYRCWYQYIASL